MHQKRYHTASEDHLTTDSLLDWAAQDVRAPREVWLGPDPLATYFQDYYCADHTNAEPLAWQAAVDHLRQADWSRVLQDSARLGDILIGTQSKLLDQATCFRSGSAYAHNGRHRYAPCADLTDAFPARVVALAQTQLPAVTQALRLYLDIIYLHPFPDGNGRAAMLWFDAWLFHTNQQVAKLHLLRWFRKRPGDAANYRQLLAMLAQHLFRREPIGPVDQGFEHGLLA